ncbi:unnamed protein product [Cladocopium goreaui]|uniref:Uncharacterized protein n=1 Tax=Cladocopium goreaui TaxID=2562237 RepID=A0A9P1GEV0_9DINO|nr:unnamed protein product [Cladocopium goreaui]
MPAPARGRSPSAKSLKKAAKKLEANKDKFTTPPPKRTGSPGVSSVSSSSSVKRKVSFAPAPEVHGTPAKKAEEKDMKVTEAEEILKSLKDHTSKWGYDTKGKQTEQLDSSSGSEDDVEAEKKKSAPKEKKGKGNREDASSKGAKQKAKKKDEDKESKKGAEEKDEEQESEKRSGEKAVSKKGGHKAEEKAASKKKGAEKKTEEKASKKDDDEVKTSSKKKGSEKKTEEKASKKDDDEEKAASKKGAEKKTEEKASKKDDDEEKAASKKGAEKMTEEKASKKDKEQKAEEKASKAEEMASKKGAEEKAEEEDGEESSDNESNDEEASESSDDSEDEEDDKSNESDESDMEKEEESQKEKESEKAEESDKEDSDGEGSSEEESDEEKEEEAEEPAESRAPAESLALVPVGILKRPAAKTEEEDHQDEDEDDSDEEQDEEDSSGESESPATKKKKTEGTKGKIEEKSKEKGDEDKKTNKKQKKAKEEDAEEKGGTEKSKALEEAEKNLLKGDTGKEKKDKKEKKAKKEKKEKDEDKEGKVKNSTKYRKEWQDTRLKLFNDYMDCGKDFAKVEALFQTRTMEDPEFPGEDEYLFFVMVEFNIEDIRELRRITQLELTGTLDADGVKAFVEAGGCLDGKQHLALGDKMGVDGIQKMLGAVGIKNDGANGKGIKRRRNTNAAENSAPKEVVPETPLQKAAKLVEKVLKDANNCRDHAFKLRPIAMSSDLILQLKACAVKLQEAAEKLQARVKQQKNKNKHYAAIISEARFNGKVNETRSTAAERISLAKALIRAVDKPKPKARASKEPKEPNASKEATGGASPDTKDAQAKTEPVKEEEGIKLKEGIKTLFDDRWDVIQECGQWGIECFAIVPWWNAHGKLAQLGKLTLDEKVKKATEEANTAEEAAIVLKDSLTKDESAKLWSKHKTYLKGKEEEKEAHEQLGKKEKGLEVVLWFLKHKKGVFFHTETSKEASETLTKGEKWVSEHKMLQDFSKDEFEQHLASGRVKWRSDPWTPGIYQYCDQGDLTKQVQLKKKHKVTVGQEREMDDAEDEKEFMSYWGKGSLASMQEAEVAFKGQGPALTKGKGQGALTKGKGSRGSKGRGREVLAIEDGNPNDTEDDKDKKTPEEQWAECLTKAQKSKEHLRVAVGNLEEALEAASQAGRTSKQDRGHGLELAKLETEPLTKGDGEQSVLAQTLLSLWSHGMIDCRATPPALTKGKPCEKGKGFKELLPENQKFIAMVDLVAAFDAARLFPCPKEFQAMQSMPAPARGRSPSAKSLKKAAKKLEANKDKFTTPPPKRTGSPGVSSVSSSSSVKRKVSFAPAPEVHGTPAKKAEEKDMKDTKGKQTEQLDSSSGSEDDVEAEKKKSAPKEKKGKGNREDASSKGAKQKAKKKDEDKESKKGAEEKDEEQESEKRSGEKAVSKKGGHKAEEKAASKKKGAEKKTEEKASKKDDDEVKTSSKKKGSEKKTEEKASKKDDDEEKAASKKGAEKKTEEKASKKDDDEEKAASKKGAEKMTEEKASKKDKEQKAEEKASKAEEMASKKGAEEKAEEEDDEESSDNESNDEEASESSDDSEDEEDDKSNESDESDMEKEEESQKEKESEKAEESDKEDSDGEGSSEEESDEEKEEEAEEPAESRAPAESLALVPVGILKRPAAKTEEEDHQDEDEDDSDEEQDEEDSSGESESPATKKKKTEGTKGKIEEKSKEKGDEDKKTNKKQKKAKEEDAEEKGGTEKSKALEEAEKNLLKGDTGKEKKDKKEKKAKKEKKEKDEDKEGKVKNSTKYRKEWQDTRLKLFNDYMDCGKDFAKVEALFQTRTMEDPEFPGEDEYLFFVMVEFNIEDIRELRRITQLELTGTLDADGVKAFVEAGGCLDGKQHLALGDKMGADGIQKMLGAVGIKNDGANGKGIKRRRNTNAAENSAPKEAHIAYPVFIVHI